MYTVHRVHAVRALSHTRARQVLLYPDVPDRLKPQPGEGLNKRFIYTMEDVRFHAWKRTRQR